MHSYSCIYFLTGSSVMVTVVRVSHGLASEQPQRVTLGPASNWTRDLSGCLGHKPEIKSLVMHSQNWCFISFCLSIYACTCFSFGGIKQHINSRYEKLFADMNGYRFRSSCVTLLQIQMWYKDVSLSEFLFEVFIIFCWLSFSLGHGRTKLAGWEP